MKIIKPGVPPPVVPVEYIGRCGKCGVVATCEEHEGPPSDPFEDLNPVVIDRQEFWARSVDCPTENCGSSITFYPRKLPASPRRMAQERAQGLQKIQQLDDEQRATAAQWILDNFPQGWAGDMAVLFEVTPVRRAGASELLVKSSPALDGTFASRWLAIDDFGGVLQLLKETLRECKLQD